MQARDGREQHGGANSEPDRAGDDARRPNLGEKHDEDGADLGEGVHLAEDGWREVAKIGGHVERGANHQNDDIPAEDHHGHGSRDLVYEGELEEQRAEQELIGNGIEIGAQHGALMQRAGEQAIERVADAGQKEQRQRPCPMGIQDGDDDEWNESQAKQRELVGSGAQLTVPAYGNRRLWRWRGH